MEYGKSKNLSLTLVSALGMEWLYRPMAMFCLAVLTNKKIIYMTILKITLSK
jgi:hypothetical protein